MNFFDFITHCACCVCYCAKMQKKSYAFINYVCFFLCFKCEVKTCFLFSSSQELKSCYFASFFPCKYECQLTSFEYISSFMYTCNMCLLSVSANSHQVQKQTVYFMSVYIIGLSFLSFQYHFCVVPSAQHWKVLK